MIDYKLGPGPQSRDHSLANILKDRFDFYGSL